jgi:hypothetical protein
MQKTLRMALLAGAAFGAMGFAGAAQALPAGWTCTTAGCGTQTATDGVVTIPTGVTEINWVSTEGGIFGQGLGISGETNGARLLTNSFTAAAGEQLSFQFNYVTSDGTGSFTDYAFVILTDGTTDLTLFTARTTPSGDTVPGFGLPGLAAGVTLTPGSTPIIDGPPDWSPLSESAGTCFAGVGNGCGHTGWIQMDYTIGSVGNYQLIFGVMNMADSGFQSGLAVAGAPIAGDPITPTVPTPAAFGLFGLGLLGLAAARRRRA